MVPGDNKIVRLIDRDLLPTQDKWEVLEITGESARVKNLKTGQTLRVHKSRLTDKIPMTKIVCDKCGKSFTTKSGLTLHSKACKGKEKGSNKMAKATTVAKASKPAKETKKETKKAKKDLAPFDIKGFVGENGGEHWVRGENGEIKFDHAGYRLETHAVMDEKAGYYFILNTYINNGVTSLGRGNKGVTKYPLKGKKVSYTISETSKKVGNRGQKRERKGTKSADEQRKHWEKQGYVKKN